MDRSQMAATKLHEEEEKQIGHVALGVWVYYGKQVGCTMIAITFALISFQVYMPMVANVILGTWTSDVQVMRQTRLFRVV